MKKKELADILVEMNALTLEKLQQAQSEQKLTGQDLEKILLAKNYINSENLAKAVAKQLNIEYVKISDQEIGPQVVNMISVDLARQYKTIPIKSSGNTLWLAFVEPWDLYAIEEIKLTTGFEIKPLAASATEVFEAIERYYKVQDTSKQTLIDLRFKDMQESQTDLPQNLTEEISALDDIPIVKLLNEIMDGAVNASASDIHLEPQFPEMIVRYRVDGILHDIMTIPKAIEASVVSRIKVLANMDITEHRRPQDGHIRIEKNNKEFDIRVSTLLTVNGENVVMRILEKSSVLLNLEKLGLTAQDNKVFQELVTKPYGMILVTGPTGSGKTTTLYAVLNRLDSIQTNIITIEDPVEYRLNRVTQIQVDPGANMTFASGLRTILRQDPDVIMVGEIRDKETAEIAIQAALTGHLVLSTLHTNDAASAVTRLIDMGIEPFLIASTVIGVLAQRLCRIICPECKLEITPDKAQIDFLKSNKIDPNIHLAKGQGCSHCYHTGFKGRSGIYEIMPITENLRKLIVARNSHTEIKKQAQKDGMRTLEENGQQKIIDKVSTIEEIKRVVYVE